VLKDPKRFSQEAIVDNDGGDKTPGRMRGKMRQDSYLYEK